MEESLATLQLFANFSSLETKEVKQLSPLVLAYIGDAVFELIIRSQIVTNGNKPVSKLHRDSANLVNAHAQAELAKDLMDKLTEEELGIFKRGRNTTSHSVAKNASVIDYRMATGFEALIGYLYLTKNYTRIEQLLRGREHE